jgi:predicted DNA-binding transcriptional regulator AlpA
MSDMSQLVNLSDAAELCGISRQSIYYHIRKGDGPAVVTIAGKPHFEPAAILAWQKGRLAQAKRKGKP